MTRALAALSLLFAAGCYHYGGNSDNMIDECDAANLVNERCVTLHLTGEAALSDAQVTQVVAYVHYSVAGVERNVKAESPDGPPAGWPIAIGLHYPLGLDGTSEIYVEALTSGTIVAYGTDFELPTPGQHGNSSLTLNRPEVSGCFDGVFDSTHESGVDCGEECPPCGMGLGCFVNANCLSESCVFNSQAGSSTCQ